MTAPDIHVPTPEEVSFISQNMVAIKFGNSVPDTRVQYHRVNDISAENRWFRTKTENNSKYDRYWAIQVTHPTFWIQKNDSDARKEIAYVFGIFFGKVNAGQTDVTASSNGSNLTIFPLNNVVWIKPPTDLIDPSP